MTSCQDQEPQTNSSLEDQFKSSYLMELTSLTFTRKNILRSVREAERTFTFQMNRPSKRRNWELPTKKNAHTRKAWI